jgi:IS1 family transposase
LYATIAPTEKKDQQCPALADTLVAPDPHDRCATTLELDEMWSFVLRKTNQSWVWLAICRKTRQVVAYVTGDRSEKTGRKLWNAIPATYQSGTCSTDFWKAYALVIPDDQHEAVGKETGETAHSERFNTTIRQRLARFVRKTLSFSKSQLMHDICLRLFLWRYNMDIRQQWLVMI